MTIREFSKIYGLDAELLEERAAIIEYDGGETRKNSELMAIATTMRRERPLVRYVEWLSVWTGGKRAIA